MLQKNNTKIDCKFQFAYNIHMFNKEVSKMTVAEFIDYVATLAVDNPDILDLAVSGFVIDNEVVVTLTKLEAQR